MILPGNGLWGSAPASTRMVPAISPTSGRVHSDVNEQLIEALRECRRELDAMGDVFVPSAVTTLFKKVERWM